MKEINTPNKKIIRLTELIYLKPAKIIIITKQSPEALDKIYCRIPGKKWHAQVDKGFDSIRPERAEVPGNDSAPVMANQEDLVDTQMVEKADKVAKCQ
jgi:hypothetical protein